MSALDRLEAEKRRDQIKLSIITITKRTSNLLELVAEAKANNDHTELGYAYWTDYVSKEFGGLLTGLEQIEKRDAARLLSTTGMSSRAIAPIVGRSDRQVRRDISGGTFVPPAANAAPAPTVTGMDGKTYPVQQPRKAPRRRPISDQYHDAVYELQKAVDRLQRLHDDDRFQGAREAIVWGDRARLARPVDQLRNLLDQLDGTPMPLPIEGVVQ